MSVVSFACCQVEVSATGRSLVQRSPADCLCVTECAQVQQETSAPPFGQNKKDDAVLRYRYNMLQNEFQFSSVLVY
jgi:hypothetical protein